MKYSQSAKIACSHVLLYGEPKSGKSTLVAKLILSGFKLWWFDLDNGREIFDKKPFTPSILEDNLELFVIPDTRNFSVGVSTITRVLEGKECLICDRHGQINCRNCKSSGGSLSRICINEFGPKDILVLDHAGVLADSIMNRIIANEKGADPDNYKPTFTNYMQQGTHLSGIFGNLQQSTANIILITHSVESELEDGTKKIIPVCGTRNYSRNLGKFFGHVVYLSVTNATHRVGSSTTYKASVLTGSRTDVEVEKLPEASLVPFFTGAGLVKRSEHGEEIANSLLGQEKAAEVSVTPTKTEAPKMSALEALRAKKLENKDV